MRVRVPEAVTTLLRRGKSPLGPHARVDFGVSDGPLAQLAALLSHVNGFTVFDAGIQLFHVGPDGLGPELGTWNDPDTWKNSYGTLVDDLFCFAQDILGTQFAIVDNQQIVAFNPETADHSVICDSLGGWAQWLLSDPVVNGTGDLAGAWQDDNGPLNHDQRLIPLRLFTLGGAYALDNLVARDAIDCMRIRGPLARQIHDLPDGTTIRLGTE